ncbi:EamA family transporter [Rouxiella silvae]|uniref:Threonine/homoserine exporter RhtA n=1 Tax=Rouxiella silvae TaxID=1646373 RepID=A0ABX3U3Z3_9GAMM|nr:DMT family transporter [Rouxiella silvae]ORJ22261.1 EamA family transporter [Rouxiella silvae]
MPYLLLILATLFWGGNYVAGHMLVSTVNPYLLSLIRWGLTSALMFSLYWKTIKNEWHYLTENMLLNSLYAFLGQVCFPLTLYIGLQYTSSLNAALYISVTPCLVIIINFFFFHEKITRRNIIGAVVSTAGVIYLATANARDGSSFSAFGIGDILTIISALSWAFYCALLRLKDKRVTNTAFVGFCSLMGTLILLPIYFGYRFFSYNDSLLTQEPNFSTVLGVLYLVIFPSWLAYVFWSKGVSMLGTTRSEIFTHIIPVSGGLFSILLLGETLQIYHLISLILITFGIACCSGKSKFGRYV